MDELKNRVIIVQDFDMLAADIIMDFCAFCRSYDVVETVKILQEKE
jgi:hypothetical protein